ncbi:hypothetical protein GCM10023258_11620 [Terrabacter aeriphilus]|uniref:Subunit length determinant protein n=1 Tax=Terrabacter aeriphilus TaxID=515662 RepID=A0ABP9J8N6_9MICO
METIPPTEVTPHLVRQALRHHWILVLVPVVLLAAVGTLLSRGQQPDYTSVTSIMLKPTLGNPLSQDSAKSSPQITVAMSTEAGLVTSPQVTDLVNAKLGTDLPASSTAISAQVPANSQILQISASGASPEAAQSLAAAFGQSYLEFRAAQSKKLVDAQVADLTAQEKAASDGLKKATTDADSLNPPADAVARLQLFSNRVATLQDALTSIKTTDSGPGLLVAPATAPTSSDGIPAWAFTVAGGALGLGLGFVLALWRQRTDRRIRFDEAASVAGLPVLAATTSGDELDPEAVRMLRSSVARLSPAPAVVGVVPVDAEQGSAVSVTAAGHLARSLVSAGYRVALLDATQEADGSRPGLSDWLLDLTASSTLRELTEDTEGVLRVGAGTRPADAQDLLAGHRFVAAVEVLASSVDYVIVAGSSVLGGGSGGDLALVTTGALAVCTDRLTTIEQVEWMARAAARTGPALLGLVALPRGSATVARRAARGSGSSGSSGGSEAHRDPGRGDGAPRRTRTADGGPPRRPVVSAPEELRSPTESLLAETSDDAVVRTAT